MAKRLNFSLTYGSEALEHLAFIETKHHRLIMTTIEEQLTYMPLDQTRNRKPVVAPAPYKASWELRCGPGNRFRVFYEVEEESRLVTILAIGEKDRSRLLFGGEEYTP